MTENFLFSLFRYHRLLVITYLHQQTLTNLHIDPDMFNPFFIGEIFEPLLHDAYSR